MNRLLFNPGPTNTRLSTRMALVTEDMSHRAPAFAHVLAEVRERIVTYLNGADTYSAVMFAASGTGANEAALGSVQGPVLAVVTGRYSDRMAQIAESCGHKVDRVELAPFEAVDVDVVARHLDDRPDVRTLVFVHHETTTGQLLPMRDLCAVAAARGVTTVVDAISSVGAHEIDLADHGPDWLTITANKGLEGLPGVSFVVARTELLAQPRPAGHSFYFDVARQWRAQQERTVPFTVPVQIVFALREALEHAVRETPAGRAGRYALMAELLRDGLVRRGFELVPLPAGQRSNVVVPVRLPAGLDHGRVKAELEALNVEIYSASEALAAGYFFLAAMGPLGHHEIEQFLDTLLAACTRQGLTLAPGTPLGGAG